MVTLSDDIGSNRLFIFLQMVTLSDDSAVRIWRLARPLVGAPGEGSDMEVGKCERMQREVGTCGFINTFTGVCSHVLVY